MPVITPAPALTSLESVYAYYAGAFHSYHDDQQWFDLYGKKFLSFQLYTEASEGHANDAAFFTFSNTCDHAQYARGAYPLTPTTIEGPASMVSMGGGQGLLIPADPGNGTINVYAAWENIPFRYVKFGFSGLGAVMATSRAFAHVYAH